MKRILFIIFILNLISTSMVWADAFSAYFPEQTNAIINLDMDESKEYLSWTKGSMMDKTYNEVISCLSEKLSLDLSKDLKEIRICFINVKMGFLSMDESVPFFFINGNFKNKDSWKRLINSLVKETTSEEAKESELSVKGEEKQVFTAGNLQFILLSDNILLIGVNGTENLIKSNRITFVEAPKGLIDLSKQAKSYAFFTRKNLWKVIFISDLFYESKHFTSVSAFIKDNVINLIGNLDDPKVIEEETKIFKEDLNKFFDNYKNVFEEGKNNLRKVPLNYLPVIAKRAYLDALFKKIIDNITVKTNEDSIIVSFPFEKYLIKHIILNLAGTGINNLNLNLDSKVLLACVANRNALSKAIYAYNKNDNSDLHYNFSFKEKDRKDEYYTSRKIKERIMKPNNSGKTTMFIDVDTLFKNDCLDIEPIKPDPECEYVVYRNFNFSDYKVFCLKHSFCLPTSRTNFGRVYRSGHDSVFFNPGKKQILDAVTCYKNQKQLSNSVESYNQKHDSKMKKLDISELLESGCLDKAFVKPDTRCDYFSYGDLTTDDGCIYCKSHGPESYKIGNDKIMEGLLRLRNFGLSKVDLDTIDVKDIKMINKCAFNIRNIAYGIKTYNEKEDVKITTNLNIQDLIDAKKIWGDPRKDNPDCEYYIEGDMTNGGHVACKTHGHLIY